jgi:hypothetical protein
MGGVLLAAALVAGAAEAPTEEPPTERPLSERTPTPDPGRGGSAGGSGPGAWVPLPGATPIRDSIEPVVERYVREHFAPCDAAAAGVPCFPVTLEVKGRQYSVRETLDDLQTGRRPVPGSVPSASDMIQHGANPHPTSASVGVDPKTIACKTKQLLRKIQGRSRTYYLYRVWDETGERAVLRDRPLDPNELAGSPHFRYVPLGEFGDECEALRAYLASTHDVRFRRETERDGEDEAAEGPQPPHPRE